MEFDLFGERRSSHWVTGGGVSRRELLGLAHVSSPFGRGWVRVRKLELHNRKPDAVSCFLCIMPHMESRFSDLIGRDCLTPPGDRVTVELIAMEGNLPPHFIVTRFVYLRITISYSKHP